MHPNHLIYNFVGYLFYKLLRALGAEIRAVTALQILNCLLSAVCARIFFSILMDTLRSFVSGGVSHVTVCIFSNVVEVLHRCQCLRTERAFPADQFLPRAAKSKSATVAARRDFFH